MKFNWSDIGKKIGSAAPMIATLVGGPAAGAVTSMVASTLGVENNSDAIGSALASDPGALLKIKELEFTHKEKLEELSFENTKAHLADRQSARTREIENLKAGGSNTLMYTLGCVIVVGFFLTVIALIFRSTPIPTGSKDAVMLLLGSLIASFACVVQYFFGSSQGSANKTAMLGKNKGDL